MIFRFERIIINSDGRSVKIEFLSRRSPYSQQLSQFNGTLFYSFYATYKKLNRIDNKLATTEHV